MDLFSPEYKTIIQSKLKVVIIKKKSFTFYILYFSPNKF